MDTYQPATPRSGPGTWPYMPSNTTGQRLLAQRHLHPREDQHYQLSSSRRGQVPQDESHVCASVYSYWGCGHETQYTKRDGECYRCADLNTSRCSPETVEVDRDEEDCPACVREMAKAREEKRKKDEERRAKEDWAKAAARKASRGRERERSPKQGHGGSEKRYKSF